MSDPRIPPTPDQGAGAGTGPPSYAGAPYPGAPYAGVPPAYPRTNGLAVAALVLGITVLCGVGSILALVFGLIARKQIDESGGTQKGRGMAIAGIVLGPIGIGLVILYFAFLAFASHTLIHVFKPLADDWKAQADLTGTKADADLVVSRDPTHSLASVTVSSLQATSSGIPLSTMCGTGVVCVVSGTGNGYSYYQLCEVSPSGSAWLVSQTSATATTWYGRDAHGGCPTLGDPGAATGRPHQRGQWAVNAFPGGFFNLPVVSTSTTATA